MEAVRTDVRVSIVFSARSDESGQVPDEQLVELAFVVWNHPQVYVMYPVSMFRGVEWEDFIVFVDENVDADCWI